MSEEATSLEGTDCPDCGEKLTLAHIGTESPRAICGRFGCSFDGQEVTA